MDKCVVAIPYWESDEGKREVLNKCLASLKGYDQLLVLAGKQPTLPIAWNMCLDLAFETMQADYCVLMNDDVILTNGEVRDLCKPDTVVSPLINGSDWKIFHAHVFSLPKNIWEKVGRIDERFACYWSDTDYAKRLVDAKVQVEINRNVDFMHEHPARTLQQYQGITEKSDEEKFVEKWGRTWFDPVRGT
jgi:hypothetical protein